MEVPETIAKPFTALMHSPCDESGASLCLISIDIAAHQKVGNLTSRGSLRKAVAEEHSDPVKRFATEH
jgi:hypothetical protein